MNQRYQVSAKIIHKYSTYETVFLISWVMYSLETVIFNSELQFMYDIEVYKVICDYIVLTIQIVLIATFFHTSFRYKKFELVVYIFFILTGIYVSIKITNRALLVMTLLMISAMRIDFDKFVRFDVKVKVAIFLLVVSLCQLGLIRNYSDTINNNYKQAFGFSHPNAFTCYALTILLELLFVRFKRLNWFDWALQIICSSIICRIGGGRSSAYSYFIILILFFFAKNIPKIFQSRCVRTLFTFITPLLAVLSISLVQLYNEGDPSIITLDKLWTYRIRAAANLMERYDIHFFGQEIEFIGKRLAKTLNIEPMILDMAYIRGFLMYGQLYSILFIGIYVLFFRKTVRNNRIDIALIGLFFVILGLTESYLFDINYNIVLLYLLSDKLVDTDPVQYKLIEIKTNSTYNMLNQETVTVCESKR